MQPQQQPQQQRHRRLGCRTGHLAPAAFGVAARVASSRTVCAPSIHRGAAVTLGAADLVAQKLDGRNTPLFLSQPTPLLSAMWQSWQRAMTLPGFDV